jgi:hypothetical protein
MTVMKFWNILKSYAHFDDLHIGDQTVPALPALYALQAGGRQVRDRSN